MANAIKRRSAKVPDPSFPFSLKAPPFMVYCIIFARALSPAGCPSARENDIKAIGKARRAEANASARRAFFCKFCTGFYRQNFVFRRILICKRTLPPHKFSGRQAAFMAAILPEQQPVPLTFYAFYRQAALSLSLCTLVFTSGFSFRAPGEKP